MNSATPAISSSRITGDVAIQIVSLTGNVALGVVVTAILARQLGPVGFGEWSTIFAVIGITGYLADLKMQEVAIREIATDPGLEAGWLGALVSLQLAIVAPVAALSTLVLLLISGTAAMRTAAVIVSASQLAGVLMVTGVVFRLRVRNDLAMIVLTFNSLAWAAAVAIIAWYGGGIIAFALAFTVCSASSGALTVLLARRKAVFRIGGSRRRWNLLARFGFVLGLAGLLSLAHSQIDQLIVYELAPRKTDAGLYGGLNRVLIRAMTVPNAVMTTMFPLIAAAVASDLARARRLVRSALEYLAMISLPTFAFVLVASRPLLRLLYGHGFVAAAGVFPIVMASFVVSCWGYVSANMVIILGLQRRFIAYVVLGLGLNIGLNLLLVPGHGYRAAAWVTLLTETVVIGLSLRAVLGEMRAGIPLLRVARIACVVAALTGGLLLARVAGAGLLVLSVVALAGYPALLLATRTIDREELRELLRSRAGDATQPAPPDLA